MNKTFHDDLCPLDWDDKYECPYGPKPEYPGGPLVVYVDDTTPYDCDKCNQDYADKHKEAPQLSEITDSAQFPQYYSNRLLSLITTEDKITHLKKEMGIKFTSTERSGASMEEVLAGLEESVLYGNWRVFR